VLFQVRNVIARSARNIKKMVAGGLLVLID
jgi:hypothetical protein